VTFLSHDQAKGNLFLASLMEKFPNDVNDILTKDASSFHEVKNNLLNLYLASGNGESVHLHSAIKILKSRKREPNPLVLALPNPVPPAPSRMPPTPQT
jgi:hypothetical protein